MASLDHPVSPRQSLAFYTSLLTALFYLGNAMPDTAVHVKVAPLTPTLEDGSLPDQLSLVIQDDSGWETDVLLNRVEYIEPNIPVYTNGGGHKGGSDFQLAELEDNQNLAYYQSANHEAAIQVTQVDSSGHFLVSGELVVNGTRCSLTHGDEAKRDLSSSSDLVYTLHELPPLLERIDDVHAEPHQREFQPHASKMPSEFSPFGRPSETLLSRDTQNGATDVYVDLVAVADYKRYSAFYKLYGSKTKTLKNIREHYNSIINRVDGMYQAIGSREYSIHVRLVSVYADLTASLRSWSMENFLTSDSNQLDAHKAIDYLARFAATKENPFLPYDHLMFFTGCDMTNSTAGIAMMSTICTEAAVSIVAHISESDVVLIAAHELAHSLSAKHDGNKNHCDNSTYTMSPGVASHRTSFSICSVSYFRDFINLKLQDPEGRECLLEQLPARSKRSSP